jgi:hypothetical protein
MLWSLVFGALHESLLRSASSLLCELREVIGELTEEFPDFSCKAGILVFELGFWTRFLARNPGPKT